MSIILPAIVTTLSMLIGFLIGRCFRDLEAMSLVQDFTFLESENEQLREDIASARSVIEEMQTDIEAIAAKYAEVNTHAD